MAASWKTTSTPPRAARQSAGLAHIALDEARPPIDVRFAGRMNGVQQGIHHEHVVAGVSESAHHVRADESGATGDEDAHERLNVTAELNPWGPAERIPELAA